MSQNLNYRTKIICLAACLIVTSSSCMKKPELEDNDGTEATTTAVQQSLLSAWDNADALSIQKSEFVSLEKTIQISSIAPRQTLKEGITVSQVIDRTSEKEFHLLRQTEEYTDGNESKLSTTEQVLTAKKNSAVSSDGDSTDNTNPADGIQTSYVSVNSEQLSQMNFEAMSPPLKQAASGTELGVQVLGGLLSSCIASKEWDVKCYNLRFDSFKDDPPFEIRQRSDCGGHPSCKITKKRVRFDLVLNTVEAKTKAKVKQKALYTIVFSPDLPYLARMTEWCYQGLGVLQNQKIPVKFCQNVLDYRRGQ